MKRIFSLVVALMAMQLMFAAKIQVTNTSGDPTVEGSLPWACENGTSSDTIVFKFSTNGKKVINISNYLSPTASIDGSTYSDSIIIDGSLADGEHVSQGLSRTGAFVKNIVVQNFVTGIRTSYGSKIIGCVIRNNTTDGVLSNNQEIFENCKITNNGDCGIDNYTGGGAGTISSIENCEISGNKLVGIRAGVAVMKKTSILNNHIGLHALNAGDEISDCVISGNDSIGVYTQYMYDKFSNNIVGLSKDERTPNPNGVGVLTQGGFENFTDNVISGNRKDGIIDNSRQAFGVFKGNYVGTNRYFDVGSEFGNGGNGFVTSGGAYGCIDEFSDNYFGNNGGYGLYKERVTTSITLSNSYFGVTPNGDPMPNGSGGLNFGPNDLTLDNCHISYNEGNGITYQGVNLIVSGGEIGHNKGYGIDYGLNSNTLRVTNVTFNNNQGSPIHVAATRSIYESLYSCNKFLNTQRSPIDYSYTYPAPQITTCKAEDGVISMAGMVDTAAKAKIELFLTAQGPNNATTFVDSFYTDADGKFTFSLPIKDLGGNSTIDFVATATYDKRHTSTLSAPKSPDYPEIDLTRKSYYVKVDGTGDGSSWEKAMSPQSFAQTLPQVRDGVTFYVAEGTYKPVYDHKLGTPSDSKYATYFVKERSNVTIQGGYPAQPEEGAVSDPSKYQAIFDGDILGNDVIDETLDEDGFPSLERTNGEDNVNTMFSPQIENILVLDGVVVKNAGSAVSGYGAFSVITLKNSSFENNGSAVKLNEEYGGEKELRIYSCSFVKNTASLFDVYGQSNIVMDSVIIEYNLNSTILNAHYNGTYTIDDTLIVDGDTVIYLKIAGANLSMNRVHVTKNKGMILVDDYSVKVENSEFANNQVAYVFNLGYPRSDIYTAEISNCKFLQNKGKAILADSHVLSVDNCLFEGNKGNNLIQITGTSSLRTPHLITNSIVKENESTGSNGSLIYCSSNSNLYMHNNLFTGNVIPENSLLYCYSLDSIAVTNSTFQENDAEYLVEFVGSKKKLIEGNTITRNNTTGYLFHLQSGSTVTTFKNNTVCSNECQSSLIFSGEDPSYLYNNTIVGNKLSNTSKLIDCDDYHTFVHTIGNIILGNSVPNGKTEYLAIRGGSKRNYNIMSYTETDSSNHHCHELPDESNIMSIYDLNAVNNAYPSGVLCRDFLDYASRLKYSPEEILTTLFEGTYDKETNLFTPKLMNNGGPTSTLALKTDKLPDGTSIRFPLSATTVTTDQRGVERLDSTCMGAYEAACLPDTTKAELPDTIYAGEEFLGVTYAYACRIDSIYETLQNINGCDSVVMHTLIVKPDSTEKNYYVKMQRHGTGNGFSWENAMDGVTFARILPDVPEGTTFHIAAGTYDIAKFQAINQVGTGDGIYINSPVTIIGGYPADALGDVTPNPSANKTLLKNGFLKETGIARNPAHDLVFDGLYFDFNCSGGIIDTYSSGDINVVVKNCVVLPTSSHYQAAIHMLGTKSLTMENDTVYGDNSGDCVWIHCIGNCSIKNCVLLNAQGNGISIDAADTVTIENCLISGATTGINETNAGARFLDIKESTVINSKSNGIFSNGIACLKNNRIGIDDNGNVAGNRIGVYLYQGGNSIVEGNIIAGNDSIGLLISNGFGTIVKDNYIGTDRNFKDLGNKRDGIYLDGDQTITFPSSLDSANYIGFNKGHGICLNYARMGFNLTCNYVGVSPQGTPMPNGKYGIYMKNPTSTTKTTKGNVIGFNEEGGIYMSDYSSNNISENLFFGTKGNAITKSATVYVDLSVPSIVRVEKDGDFIRVEGTTDTSVVTTIELFYTNGDPQTAHEFLGSTETDNTGAFMFSVPAKSLAKYGGMICFSATATYPYRGTSYLSDPYCACISDTTLSNDTIFVGEKFLDKVYSTVGRHDSIFESLQNKAGCDSVVMHTLFVKPDPTRNEYYVKMGRHGKGDGSSWDNAMDSVDFATYLPLAPDGTTFYVAEGTYKPVYDSNMIVPSNTADLCYAINNGITIRGGYPADATGTNVASEPDKYHTVFIGDVDKDGVANVNAIITAKKGLNVYGIDFKHVIANSAYASAAISAYGILNCVKCDFDSCATAISMIEKSEFYVDSCTFKHSSSSAIYVRGTDRSILRVSNSDFSDNHITYPSTNKGDIGAAIYQFGTGAVSYIDKCTFNNNSIARNTSAYTGGGAIYIGGTSYISDCEFKNNSAPRGGAIWIYDVDTCVVDRCYFDSNSSIVDNGGAIYSIIRSATSGYKQISNSTFVNNKANKGGAIAQDYNNNHIVNNTFFGNENTLYVTGNSYVAGNIIVASNIGSVNSTSVGNNLVSDDNELDKSYSITTDQLSTLFDGTYDATENVFTPVVDTYGGVTSTIALKSDKLPDGTSIRFPLTETVVTTDQRGETRLDPTCMGAYEIKCSEVKNTVTDTVTVGDPYTLNGIDLSALTAKVGIHTYNDTIKLENDCDSIVNLILAVRPQKKDGGYYVKVDGTGDGSDWLNAMSPEDFATYLPLAYDGDTFHVAAGTYHPFEEIPGMGLGYKVNSSVVLVGGYPDTATILETQSNPMLYETVLSANVSQKDYFFSYVECSTSPFSSVEDNLSTLIYADEKVNLSIFGMTLSGVYSCDRAAIQLDAAESSLNLEHCVVSKNAATAIKASNGSHITVNECYFNENYTNRAGVFDLSDATLKVTHSTFDHNRVSGTYCPADNIDSVAGVAFLKNSIAEIENSTFTYNNATKGGVFYLDGSNLSLTNVTITGNGNFTDDATDGSVIYSSTNPSDVKLFGNIIVGNGKSVFAGDGLSVSSSNYNIFSQQPSWEMGEKDLLMNDDEMITILDGEINNYYPKSYFQPVLRLVEGYTPIVAVITSTFSGGEVLSILHKDQRVKDDQRGFLRKDTCCIGAYEFPTLTDYYVKVIATGDGSGRDWNNAMSDTTFATYFPIVPDEATFHIAAGTYYPLKDKFGHFAKSAQCFYSTTRSINMIGGYPELAKEGDTTDPSVNFTVLSVDHNHDNTVSIVKFDDDYSYININNISDNGYRVIDITPKSSGETTIYGIIFEGSKSIPRGSSSAFSYYGPNEQDSKLTLDHCTFRKSYSAVSISATTVVVNECRFDSIEAYAFSAISYTPAELTLSKSTFNLTGTAVNLREVINAEISNNTIVDARTSFEYRNSGFEKIPMNVKMYNNTVSNGANFMSIYNTISEEVKLEAKGNIFNIQKCYFSFYDNTPPAITSDYNIFTSALDSEGNTWKLGEHDVLLQPTDLAGVLDGTYSDEKASFAATLSENGGFCDNVSLLNVILPNDKSIKMIPTGTTTVTDDQRYVKRDEVYCAGSYEVDCSFSNGNLKLVPSNTDFCRDDTVIVKLEGLSKLEANTFKYQWFADNDSVRAFDADSNAVKFHLYSHQSNPRLNVTITNACGNDTTINTSVHVNGTGAVPFSGIEENDIVCQNAAQPIELTTNVAGAVFEGECIVNEHFFDPSLATADTSLIRCWVETGECKSFDDKLIHLTKSESFVLEAVEGNLNLTCSNEVGYATLQIMSESEDEFDAYFDTKHIGTYKSNDKIEIKAIEKGSHTLFVESKVEVCPASSSIPLNVSAPDPISVRLESQGVGCGATVTAFASGETDLYQYVWKNEAGEVLPSTSEVLSGIGAGTYTCIVSSVDCGTKVTEQATIDPVDDKGELSVTFVKTDETCIDGNNGTVTVTLKASNPNEKVTVVLTSDKDEFKKVGSQRGGDIAFDNLPPTQYVMTAYFGSEDCVSAPTDVKETINIAKKTTKLSIASVNSEKNTCLSPLNGYISATVNGWDNGYVALLNDTPVEPSNVEGEVATFKLESVSAGDYVFYVEDNCKTHSDSKNVSISSIDPYKLEIVKYTDTLDCAKSLMGYAQFKKEGGNEENSSVYIVGKTGWSSLNEDQIVLVSGNYFANLKKDQYTLYYKSNLEGCLDADSLKLTVKGPDTLAADYVISCKEDETVIKVTASGENGEYKYRWNGGDFSLETDDPILAPSTLEYGLEYTCEVRDSKGCDKKSFTFSFVHPDKLKELKMRYSLDPQSCIGVPNAKIYAVAAQKEDKYEATFVLMNTDDNSVVNKISVSKIESAICFSDLPVGNYQLKLRYGGEDCEMGGPSILSDTIKVEPLLPLKGQLGETTGLTCLNEPNGKAEISLSSGWSKHHISTLLRKKENKWDVYNESLDATSSEGQSALYEINGLEGGSYQFIIKDDCGKDSMKFSFDVSDFEPYSIQLVNKTKFLDCYTDDTAHIEVNVSGGYFFDNEFYLAGVDTLSITKAENFKYTDLTAGLYHFHYGTTQEGCSDSVMLDVEIETDSIFVNLDNSGEMCYDAKLQATVKGGKEPYTLVWGNENADSIRIDNAEPFVLENVGVANYFATVVDKIGCKAHSETVYAQLVGDMSKENGLRIDSISLNALQCLFPSENGDIRVFVVGNTYRANVSVKVKRDNNLVNEVTTSAESDTITFDGLPFDQTYQLSVSFQGAEECAVGNDNLNRSILLTKPEPFSVDFTATKVLCENSHDAEIASNIHAGAHTYHYEWHKLIEDKEDEIITHDVLTSDTLRDLRKEERYFCKVVDQNFCESLSDTFTIGYSKADTMQLDTFEYDERQRCKGVDNAHMYVSFNKVAPWVNAQFDLSVVDGDALDKQDQDENNDRIHINELGPNKYHLIAGYGVEGCPTLLDTIVEIFEMVGDLKVAANPDSTHDALCVSTKDGAIYFHLDGVAKKQVVEIYDEEDNFLKKVQQDSLSVERGFYKLTGLLAGTYKVKVTNDCDVKDASTYTLGGYNKYELALEEDKSHLSLQCPYSEDGAIAFSIIGHESNFTLNFMTYDTTIIDNYKDSIIVSDCVIRDSTRMKDTIYTMYNRDETSVSVHSSVAPKMETKVIDDQTVYNYYLSVDSILGEVDTFAVVKELLPGSGVQYKYTVKEKSGAIKWELSNISIVDTIAPTEQDGDTLYRFHTMVDSLVCVRDTDNMKMTWNYVMDPNNDTLFLYQYYEIPTKCFDTISVIAGKVVQYHPVLNELDANDATLKDGIYYFTNFKKGDYYIKAKTTMENCPDADTMNVKITAPNDVLLTKEILPVSCRSKNDGSVSLKPYRVGSEDGVLYFGRDSILFKSNYKANYLYKRTATKHDQNGDDYTTYDYKNVIYNGDTVMVNINDLSNYSSYFVKKHDGSNVSVTSVAVDGNVDQATLFGGDIVSVDWKRMNDAGIWEKINDQIVWPASTDSLEETYFSSNGDTIKGLVWGASHLETFWDDYMGTYQEVGAQTVANMSPAKYSVHVTDAVGCVYDFDFEVKEPEDALKIESVEYNASLALCKPEERHIFVRASGGWGYYKYSFSAEADTSIGYVVDKYHGGEAYSYDPTANTGWGRSACLVDGIYKVSVFDDKGCIVTVNDPIEVKSLVKVTADTSATLCPGVISAPITLNVSNTNNYSGTYTVKEYLSACGTEISSCINDSFPTVLEHTSVDNLALTVGPGRHGYLVYEDDNNACGGYVEVVVLDTIRPMDISKKSIDSVKCYGNNDGAISLYLKGGTSPYTLSYDKFWFDEKENQLKDAHESRTYTKSQLNLILNNIEKSDGTIVVDSTYSVDINNLSAAKYCFTIVDANGCVRSLGVDGSIDTLTVRQPDSMHIDVYASGLCPDKAGLVTDNIAVFGQNAKGGIPPYLYYAVKKGETGEFSDNSYFDLPVHTNDIVTYAFKDANQCQYEKDIVVDPKPIPVERYDFILSTWSKRNDVVALIDLCAPDVAFDSVTYFINDESVEVLDKRMYIYDVHAPQNKELYEELSKVNTKTEVSDMFFQKHFNLCVDSALAKHIQFIRRNNLVTYTWNANLNRNVVKDSLKPKNDSIWVQDEIRMRAYFRGCAYDVTRNGCFIIATDNYQIYNGGLSGETDILDLQLYPNPFVRTEQDECQIRVTVASKTEGDIYLYTLDGKTADNQTGLMRTHFNANEESGWQQLAGSLYNRPNQPYVYQKTFVVKADDLKSGAEAIVVLVRTANDAKSTYLLVK